MDHELPLGSNIPTTNNSENVFSFPFMWILRRPLLRMNNHTLGILEIHAGSYF